MGNKICSMCRKESDSLKMNNKLGEYICPECSKKLRAFRRSVDPSTYTEAKNYIRTCARNTPNEDLSRTLISIVDNESGTGFGHGFMLLVAWIIWIGGFIFSIVVSREKVETRWGYKTDINWQTFFTITFIYFFTGAFAMCLSELFKNVAIIRKKLTEIAENTRTHKQ